MMQIIKFIILLFITHFSTCAQNTVIIRGGKSDFLIYIIDDKDKLAATILQNYIKQVSNTEISIVKMPSTKVENGIIVGKITELKHYYRILGEVKDGVYIKKENKNIFITGSNDQNVLYAIYTFIEEILGCRYFYEGQKLIPNKEQIYIANNYLYKYTPIFEHRQYWYFGSFVPSKEFLDWHKLHNYHTDEKWGMYMVHNLDQFVPDNLIKSYPDFFALVGSNYSISQLNYTNKELEIFLIEKVAEYFEKNPNKSTLALNPKDNEDYCLCDNCLLVYEKEGSKMGTLLAMVNNVAKHFPTKNFTVQAFKSNRTPPKYLIPEKNVKIVLSDIEVTRLYNIKNSENPRVKLFEKDLDNWLKKTNQVIVWDYVNWFENSFIPFPNFTNMESNAKYFAEKPVKGIFWEGDGGLPSYQFRLRAYLAAKLLWNPYTDLSLHKDDFLNYYYFEAAPIMKDYINKMEKSIKLSNYDIETGNNSFYKDAATIYMSQKQIEEYFQLLKYAKTKVKNKEEIVKRIEIDEIGLLIFEIELNKLYQVSSKDKIDRLEKLFKKHKIDKYNYYLELAEEYIYRSKNN